VLAGRQTPPGGAISSYQQLGADESFFILEGAYTFAIDGCDRWLRSMAAIDGCDRWHAFRARAREPRLHPTWYCPFVPQYHLRGGPHAGAGESRRVPWAILLRASSTRADRRHASGCRVTSAARRPITVDEWLDRRGRALVPYSSGITALFSSVGSRRRSRPFAVRPDGERLSMCGKRAEASIARRTGVVVRAQGSRSRANVARVRRTSGVGGPGVACNSGRTCG